MPCVLRTHGASDVGSRLMFKFRSGTHGLNEEFGSHREEERRRECGSASHVLWECPAYICLRSDLICVSCKRLLGMVIIVSRVFIA